MAYPDTITEIFTILGAPARLYGRLPFATRYLWFGFWGPVVNADYARSRYGGSWHWRPWLFFDMQELESLEDLINAGTDEQILWYRKNQLEAFQMVSIVVSNRRESLNEP
ncbi:hypothetical protein M501DRAFT_1002698 [Patellaria atrata CBS 101060]|uniref:Uncharacterized protein n=1 Tax=Patellaria atrata CBS 101060 TaxID=1346257 RepID=A0A9P4VQY1_9PEZI|nr:hypothetical protein M501DRAFT_1002698 [Patellaria atrata CBS 101060]